MKTIALLESPGKRAAIGWAEKAALLLNQFGAVVVAAPELVSNFKPEVSQFVQSIPKENFEKLADVVVTFGGDGTILAASRLMIGSDVPIMGFNVGKLGFLAEFSTSQLETELKKLVEGNYRVVERAMLEAYLHDEKIYALNDIVIEKKNTSSMITTSLYSNGIHVADYRSDGLIITTPTGSTAYSLSCGGPILAPMAAVLGITPISPHSLTHRPLVIPDNSELKLTVSSQSGESAVTADGQILRKVYDGETLQIIKSDYSFKLIKPVGSSYFSVLREKLLWALNTAEME